jgi:transcriptional regulator with XRE-family HTH domain
MRDDDGTRPGDPLERRIAERLRVERDALGWSLGELATRSGVSKATINRIERGEASPTAALLGRLCAGLGITMTALMAAAESSDTIVWRAEEQPVWHDPATGLERRVVGTSFVSGGADIARVMLPKGTVIDYDLSPRLPFHQYLVMLVGRLRFTIGDATHELAAGDCLGARIDRPTRFEVIGARAAEYLVVIDRGRA